MADQILIGIANLRPWFAYRNVKALRLSKGTEAHVFGQGSAEILVAEALKAEFPDRETIIVQHGLLNLGGVTIDYSHHGPYPGSRGWLKGNVARFYLRDLMMEEIMEGNKPPDLVLRSHYHQYICETVRIQIGDMEYTSHIVVTPSFCLSDDYTRKATQSRARLTNGMIAVEVVGDQIHAIHRLTKTLDIRTHEAIQ